MSHIDLWPLPDSQNAWRYVILDDTTPERDSCVYYARYDDSVGELNVDDPGTVREWILPEALADSAHPTPLGMCLSHVEHLWFGTEYPARLVKFYPTTSQFLAYRSALMETVWALMPDGADNCWFIGPQRVGVLDSDGGRVQVWTLPDQLPGPSAIWVDENKGVWIAAQNTLGTDQPWLGRLDTNRSRLRYWTLSPSARSTAVQVHGDSGPQNIWLTAASFAYRLNLKDKTLFAYPEDGWNLADLDVDRDGSAWMGRFDGHISRIKRDTDCGKGTFDVKSIELKTEEAPARMRHFDVAPQTAVVQRQEMTVESIRSKCKTRFPVPGFSGPFRVAVSPFKPAKPRIYFGMSFPHQIGRLIP